MRVTIDGYLLQPKLELALQTIVGSECWGGREVPLPKSRRRWDMSFKIEGKVTVVEFDGDAHYRDTLKIKSDVEKDAVAREQGYRVVRIPYWVQLTSETLAHYFGLVADISQDFPHGFITTKVFPASFCELGIARFECELRGLPTSVRAAVVASLRERAGEHGMEYVLPVALRGLLQN
jgi:hypothetical protein